MHILRKLLRRFGSDAAGILCLLLIIPLGPLPGPGGIPLLILGLSLLAKHNVWARNILTYVEERSDSLRHVLFPHHKIIETIWDITSILLFVIATVASIFSDHIVIRIMSIVLGSIGTSIILFNRNRISALRKALKMKR